MYSIITEKNNADESNYRVFYDFLNYSDDAFKADNNKYFNMKTGVAMSLCRIRFEGFSWFPSIDVEANLAGYLNTIFCMFGKNDTLDFDGSYLIGGSIRFADLLTFRIGLHHFSGHYGDEMLNKYYAYNAVDASTRFNDGALFTYANARDGYDYYLVSPVEYVRDNSWIFGVATEIPANKFSVYMYGEAELPKNPSWFRPLAHVPADYKNPMDEEGRPTLIDRIGGTAADGEQFPQNQLDEEQVIKRTASGRYKAWRIHAGTEVRYPMSFGSAFVACDVQFHQDGKTLHKIGGYNTENPWEMELTIGGGLEFGNILSDGKTMRIEAYYHDGRVPATQWFYQRMKSVSIGVGIN